MKKYSIKIILEEVDTINQIIPDWSGDMLEEYDVRATSNQGWEGDNFIISDTISKTVFHILNEATTRASIKEKNVPQT